ncbi:hypothetical protein GGI12_004264 [Dipsacomyces acuminosporus]|nr:hypothetical protein GGI12_004264 [Dipsacomyces acuminosporus]
MATNWSLCGLFFLTTREALLQEQKQKNQQLHLRFSQTRDNDEMFSSVIAGGLTGGILAFISRGRGAIFSGVGLFAFVSAVGQYSYTRMNRRRQQIILDNLTKQGTTAEDYEKKEQKEEEEGDEESDSIIAKIRRALTKDPIERLPKWFPVRKIQSEEYREILLMRKEEIDIELKHLREAIAAMNQREEQLLERLAELEK